MRKRIYLAVQRSIGSRTGRYYRELLGLERMTAGQLEARGRERLELVLRRAAAEVPFYRKQLGQGSGRRLEDFPIMTRKLLREAFADLMSDRFRARFLAGEGPSLRGWTWVKASGGAADAPLWVIHDRELRERGRAIRLYCLELLGLRFGAPHFRFCTVHGELGRAGWRDRLVQLLANCRCLNGLELDEERMEHYLELIDREQPEYLVAFAETAGQLARFARERGIAIHPFRAVLSNGEAVTGPLRSSIMEAFGAEVRHHHGHHDTTSLACECELGGFHALTGHLALEVVDQAGRGLGPGNMAGCW